MADNTLFHVRREVSYFNSVFELAWNIAENPKGKASHYKIFNKESKTEEYQRWNMGIPGQDGMALCFYWHEPYDTKDALALPYIMDMKSAQTFSKGWLESIEYSSKPDHDGGNGKGFGITTGNSWGHFRGSHYSIIAVSPEWMMCRKFDQTMTIAEERTVKDNGN